MSSISFMTHDMICALINTIWIYVNMGVKRSVRTSGIRPTILDILQNCVLGLKLKYPVSWFFLCIFQHFLCIFWESRGNTSRPPRNLKFWVLLSIPHMTGISLWANSYLNVVFTEPTYYIIHLLTTTKKGGEKKT